MIDHVSIAVRDLRRHGATRFYDARCWPTLGMTKLREWPDAAVGFGKKYPEFWINRRADMAPVAADSGVHICLRARDQPQRSMPSMPPRSRPAARPTARRACARNIDESYYAAFIRDPDGNRIEAVTFVARRNRYSLSAAAAVICLGGFRHRFAPLCAASAGCRRPCRPPAGRSPDRRG